MQDRPSDAANPVLVLSDDGADLAAAFADAGFATRVTRSPDELEDAFGDGLRSIATPPPLPAPTPRWARPSSAPVWPSS